jgi:aryl carrier-like protein
VADPVDVARTVEIATEQAPLDGVFHLAGANDDQPFESLSPMSFATTFRAKAVGAELLAEATRDQPLSQFVVFSSVAAAVGTAGQANYAAANGCLDGLAAGWRAQGRPVTSIAWGPWVPEAKPGMAGPDVVRAAGERVGVRPLTDPEAWALLSSTLRPPGSATTVAVALDPARFARVQDGPRRTLVAELAPHDGSRAAATTSAAQLPAGWLREQLLADGAEPGSVELPARLRFEVSQLVAEVLRGEPDDDTLGFADMGLDSIMVIDLREQLAHGLGVDLPATIAIDHPTVDALTAELVAVAFADVSAAGPDDAQALGRGKGNGNGHRGGNGAVAAGSSSTGGPDPGSRPDPDAALDRELDELSLDELVDAARRDLGGSP